MIGDPDKAATRKQLTPAEVKTTFRLLRQIKPLISFDDKTNRPSSNTIRWASKLNFTDIVEIASNFTVQQMIERDMFQSVSKRGTRPLHEFMYPLMQAMTPSHDVNAELCALIRYSTRSPVARS